jgi:phosphotriesterase-related protein
MAARTHIETVLGPIPSEQLGFTLSHEHTARPPAILHFEYPWAYNLDEIRELGIEELTKAKQGGVDAIIDLSTPDLMRPIHLNMDYSRATGVHIVVATGIWREIPRSLRAMPPEQLGEIFAREIQVGIQDTNVKAGVIKVASDIEGVTPEAENVLRAAAYASIKTGCPISTHQWAPGEVGRTQLDILRDAGTDMNNVCIGHSADSTDPDYLEGLLKDGAWVSMDRYPGGGVMRTPQGDVQRPTWEQRNETVKELIRRGWAHRLMMGHDYEPSMRPRLDPPGYLYISRVAIPKMIEDGVSQQAIDTMMRAVPRAFLTGGTVDPI